MTREETADRVMDMEAMPGRVPFRDPQIRERVPLRPSQRPEELGDIGPEAAGIVVSSATVGEGPETVQTVRGTVAANLTPGATGSLFGGSDRVGPRSVTPVPVRGQGGPE